MIKNPFKNKYDEENIPNIIATKEQLIYRLQKHKVKLFNPPKGGNYNTYEWGEIGIVM
jgi:hypothetical protein